MIAADSIAGWVRSLRDLVGKDLADWLDADPEELDRGMGIEEKSGRLDNSILYSAGAHRGKKWGL